MTTTSKLLLYLGLTALVGLLWRLAVIANGQESALTGPNWTNNTGTGFYQASPNVLSFAYNGQHVFSTTNLEAANWLRQRLLAQAIDTNLYGVQAPSDSSWIAKTLNIMGGPTNSTNFSIVSASVDTNLYGVLHNVSTPTQSIVERRGTDRLSGVETFPGDAVERVTNSAALPAGPPPTLLLTIIPTPWDGNTPGIPRGELVVTSGPWRTRPAFLFAEGYFTNRAARQPEPVRGARSDLAPPVTNAQGMVEIRRPIWEEPDMAEAALQWEPSKDALYYRIHARSSKTTNEWVTRPEWVIYAHPTEALINRTIVLDLSVPTETRIEAVGANKDASAPVYVPVPSRKRSDPVQNAKLMYTRSLAEAAAQMSARRGRIAPVVLPPLPP